MSLFDYRASLNLSMDDYPFAALIMSAMRKADSDNVEKLKTAFPEIWKELWHRSKAPVGVLPGECT